MGRVGGLPLAQRAFRNESFAGVRAEAAYRLGMLRTEQGQRSHRTIEGSKTVGCGAGAKREPRS